MGLMPNDVILIRGVSFFIVVSAALWSLFALFSAYDAWFNQRNIVRGNDFGQWISKFWISFSTLFTFKSNRVRKVYRSPNPKPKPNQKDVNQEKIDEILDKISQSGYASLTKEEKELLFRAGNS